MARRTSGVRMAGLHPARAIGSRDGPRRVPPMLQRGGRLLLSPSDLNNFLACEHRTALDLARARGEILLQRIPRPDAELVAERGREHERAHLAALRERGLDVEEIAPGDGAPEATAEAMRAGRDVIHQAAFVAGNWRGAADFLLKVGSP